MGLREKKSTETTVTEEKVDAKRGTKLGLEVSIKSTKGTTPTSRRWHIRGNF